MFIFFSCFINDVRVFFGAFLSPIFVVLLFNTFLLITVIVVLMKCNRTQKGNVDKSKDKSDIHLFLILMGHMFLFGLAWIFAALTITEAASLLFQIIFALTIAFQGFFIFLFFCVSSDLLQLWRQLISRGMYTLPKISSLCYGTSLYRSQRQIHTTRLSTIPSHPSSTLLFEPSTRELGGNESTAMHTATPVSAA